MAGLHLFTSNRLENLKALLAGRMKAQPLPPLRPEVIVVQSKGMQRWLSLQLADEHGIAANIAYLFPRSLVRSVLTGMPTAGETDFFSPEMLAWPVLALLPELLEDRSFAGLKHYLSDDTAGVKQFQLARQIADMLGRYCLLRPDVILAWSRGKIPGASDAAYRWQAILWRRLLERCPPEARGLDPVTLKQRLIQADDPFPGLPPRLSIFGISTLAPYYVDIFIRLAEQIDVDMYYMNPCRQYWEYVFSEKEISKFAADGVPEETYYEDNGNSLLASMGTAGREFFSLLLSRAGDAGEDLFAEPGRRNMLATVQSDVLNLTDIHGEPPLPVSPEDVSIQVHVCHSPVREVEALHDTLLAVLEYNVNVQPRDIVVMMPDVAAYAPLIQAVFDTPESPSARIPYSIADTAARQDNAVADALLAVLAMDRNRYRVSDMLDLLETPAVRRRFGLAENDLDRIRKWVREAGIRWGVDGSYRDKLGLPGFHENTWSFGLDRMLLGHALCPVAGESLFAGILPYGQFEEDNSRILGRAAAFARALFARCRLLNASRTLPEWASVLNGIVNDFFLADNEAAENDIMEIRRLLLDEGLTRVCQTTGFAAAVSLDIIHDYLEERLSGSSRTSGFINNGVTFCTLLPMRSIPFKVVCLLGMNDGDFPRVSRRPGFDLLEKQRRPCDFSKTLEDRYLFLESILSARLRLIISYVGQDIQDNSRLPPSTLVCELLDYLVRRFAAEAGTDVRQQVTVRHPLQPFSPEYFRTGGKLFSYSEENHRAAQRNAEEKEPSRILFDRPLSPPPADLWRPLAIDRLIAFFRNPPAFLIRNRLNMDLAMADKDRPEDREPFSLNDLERYLIIQDLVADRVRQSPRDKTAFEIIRASGRLPHGSFGELAWAAEDKAARQFLKIVAPYLEGGAAEPENFERLLNDARKTIVQGVFDGLYDQGQLFYRCARVKAGDILRAWLYHLALNAAADNERPKTTRLIGSDDAIEFSEMASADATARLTELAELFFQGLSEPLCFFPETSYALSEKMAGGKSLDAARTAALFMWRSNVRRPGEGDDVHISRCFGETVLQEERFSRIASSVFDPVFEHMVRKTSPGGSEEAAGKGGKGAAE